ncbi:MAG TPA: hypothetical protein VFF73_29290 [Planctomycetota bacterium]|nr:hypothetical protein [Planctomycetota bacterium]
MSEEDRELERATARIVRLLGSRGCTVALDAELPVKETRDPAKVDVAIRRPVDFVEWLVVGFHLRGRKIDDLLLDELRFRGESLDADRVFALTTADPSSALLRAARGFGVDLVRSRALDDDGAIRLGEVPLVGDRVPKRSAAALAVAFEGATSGVELAYTATGADVAGVRLLGSASGRELSVGAIVEKCLDLDARRPVHRRASVTVRRRLAGDWSYASAKRTDRMRAVAVELTHVARKPRATSKLRAASTTWSVERERAEITFTFSP